MPATRMRAAVRDRYGPPEVVEIRALDVPTPTGDQVLVRVRSASINRADLDWIQPRPAFTRAFIGLRRPRELRIGLDAAGVVEAVGPEATRFRPGDRVFADLYPFGQGAFADYVCAPERAFQPIPDDISFDVAATLPHSAILALQSLRLRGGRTITAGDRVLIDGASGNVGPFAVQIAAALGAEVTATCRTSKIEFVRSLGAHHVIDFTSVDYATTGERYDWIVDTDSHHPVLGVRRSLRPQGVYVTLGGSSRAIAAAVAVGGVLSLTGPRTVGLLLWWKPFHAPDVETLTAMVRAGTLRPAIDRTVELEDVVAGLRHLDDGHARGKIVVRISTEGSEAPGSAG